MTPLYLLDTNIPSDLVRHPQGVAAKHIADVGEAAVCTSIIVASELRYGAARTGSPRLAERVEAILSRLTVLALAPPIDKTYADIRVGLEKAGTPIGANDLLIAAQARAEGLTVVTDNEREFRRVPNLNVENWLGSRRLHP